MPKVEFGKREGFADITPHTLTKSVVPPLHMSSLFRFFANTTMRFFVEDDGICLPKVPVAVAASVRFRYHLPQLLTRFGATVTDYRSNNLACPAADCRPEPTLVRTLLDE
jgi:hypothetical protein